MDTTDGAALDFAGVRAEFDLPTQFPPAALAEAELAVTDRDHLVGAREDATGLPLVTIDPPGSKDLDQALYVEQRPDGFRLHYAIADLGTFVQPGGALDVEVRQRGQTIYLPDGNVPLHPPILSEGAASLLPGQVRPSALWTIDLDKDGEPTNIRVRRALVKSIAQFDYDSVQATIDAGNPHPSVAALPALGRLRREHAVRRGAVELQLPEQEVVTNGNGRWTLTLRPRNNVDAWNAEMSLLTGMSAASLMVQAGIGVLRTLPEPDEGAVEWLRRSARSLGIEWPRTDTVSVMLAGLDPRSPESLALYMDATRLLRGAGYTAFDGSLPELTTHAGLGAAYAHVTAPLRRLVDRFGAEICLAVSADQPVPDWVRASLPELPKLMGSSDSLASKVDRACLDQAEAWVLAGRAGHEFDAVVLRAEANSAEVFLTDPPVIAKCAGEGLSEGGRIRVRLLAADTVKRKVSFEKVEMQ
ncbi:RNB domain-containing ribonuclease [Kibdelosporangium phytohabitans]|uniref:Ribonuclease II n=1 Tax=Kibdelosporangium phytohabitans TaxID=860235 RepID=A0A0N9HQ44_9PSEU|nr:RNB domain-containing ribonuclease [Kibdelosporangium phytohabitans]ALG06789.1 ribonuclease II [Kibdelosporangium phytohabitans]MBE1468028.1 VacB/RNase II family 3'-5' exoribonuclease [Kibdelosporangium phytohabitans]